MNKENIVDKRLIYKTIDKKENIIEFHIKVTQYNGVNLMDYDTLEVVENPIELSIIGKYNDIIGQCQEEIEEELNNLNPSDKAIISRLIDIWYEYHNNLWLDLTIRQNKLLTKLYLENETVTIKELKEYLKENNLIEDNGYVYEHMSRKLCIQLPEDILAFLNNL